MTRRVTSFILASLLLLASTSAYASNKPPEQGHCDVNCFCYMATYSGGECGTISDSGCVVLRCI
jgi:hypothetical protein